jgi:hypothetical protein
MIVSVAPDIIVICAVNEQANGIFVAEAKKLRQRRFNWLRVF